MAAAPEDVSLKSLGMAVLGFIYESIRSDGAGAGAVLGPAVTELATYTESLTPRALFDNWTPSTTRHAIPLVLDGSWSPSGPGAASTVDGGVVVASASSKKGDKNAAGSALRVLEDSWVATTDASPSWWKVKLAAPTYLHAATITWRIEGGRGIPESYTVSITTDGSTWTQVGPTVVCDSLDPKALLTQTIVINAVASAVKVDMKGFAKTLPVEVPTTMVASLKDKAHGIKLFQLTVPDTLGIHVAPGASLYDLEKMLASAALSSSDPRTVGLALRGLEGLALASGSLQVRSLSCAPAVRCGAAGTAGDLTHPMPFPMT